MIRIEEKDPDKIPAGWNEPRHRFHIVRSPLNGDRTKAGMLKHEVIVTLPGKKVASLPANVQIRIAGGSTSDRFICNIETQNLALVHGPDQSGVMSHATSRNENAPGRSEDSLMRRQQKRKLRMGLPFFPGCLAGLVTEAPVDGHADEWVLVMAALATVSHDAIEDAFRNGLAIPSFLGAAPLGGI